MRSALRFFCLTLIFVSASLADDNRAAPNPLDQIVESARFDHLSLSDALDFLRDASASNIYVDWKSLRDAKVTEKTPITETQTQRKLGDILQDTLAQTQKDVQYQQRDGVIIVSTRQEFDQEKNRPGPDLREIRDSADPKLSDADRSAEKKLERRLPDVKFTSVAFADVVDFIRDLTSLNISVNWKAIEEAGIDRQTPVAARLRDLPMSAVLNIVLNDAGRGKLGYHIDHGVLVISTIDDLQPTTKP